MINQELDQVTIMADTFSDVSSDFHSVPIEEGQGILTDFDLKGPNVHVLPQTARVLD